MNIFQYFESQFTVILAKLVRESLLPENLDSTRVVFELPRNASHGDHHVMRFEATQTPHASSRDFRATSSHGQVSPKLR